MTPITLRTATDLISFDPATGRLVSLCAQAAPETELLAAAPEHPAFVLQYLTADHEFAQFDSFSARETNIAMDGPTLVMAFSGVGGLDLDVTLTVTTFLSDRFSRWGCTVRNGAGLQIVDVQFPFVVVPGEANGAVLQPAGFGELLTGDMLAHVPPDEPRRWQLIPENGNSPHYPGRYFAQFLAWYRGKSGVYLACEDTAGNVKMLGTVRREPGLRLGVAHVGDWPAGGERTLEYEVVLSSFTGDWYDAADLYRDWSLRQAWALPLTDRRDVPQWLLDSPPHITIRLQGYLDDGPAPAIEEFLPYEKCIPLLEGVAQRVESPLTAILMSWERGGPWVYPDCFPPVGGDESMTRFNTLARERGWHVGSFCNGTRWVTKHLFNGYDGQVYFDEHQGAQGVCRRHDGELWAEHWDQSWRPSYCTCMAAGPTKAIAGDFVRRLIGWGMESIQYFDQNCNAATFACYSADHGHPPMPGKWMTRAMADMIADFRRAAKDAGETEVIQSTEAPCNEFCLQLFQQSDVRVSPPSSGMANFVPVYHYLFHECTIMHGMMSTGGEPYALPIRNAWNGVLGEITGAVLTGDGTLLNRETFNWADWEPKVGSDNDSLEMIRTMTQLRRGAARDFLVYGRMQRPAKVTGVQTVEWDHNGRHYAVPAVTHAAWQAPDGHHGIVLANWTTEDWEATIVDGRLGAKVVTHTCGRTQQEWPQATNGASGVTVTVPALGCVLVASAKAVVAQKR